MPGVSGSYPAYGIPDHIENWATLLAAVGALGALLFCLRHAFARRSPLALFLFCGAGLTILIEPFPDVLGKAVFAEIDRIPWTGGLGRQIPAYVGLIYFFYLTPAYVLLLDAFERGLAAGRLLAIYGAMAVGALAFEFVPMHYDLWRYYGSQGLHVGEMPIWWGFINSQGVVATAVVLHLLLKVLPRNRQFVVIALMPAIFLGTHTAGAIFGYLTVGTTNNSTTTTLGTLATCLLCVCLVRLYSAVVCRPAGAPVVPSVAKAPQPVA
jgi:hypothetical protein